MMFKEKYSKLHTDRISVSLSPLMEQSRVTLKARKGNEEWKESNEKIEMGFDFDYNSNSNSNSSPSRESGFWETEF